MCRIPESYDYFHFLPMLRTSNTLLKLPNTPFLLSPHLTRGEGPCISHLGPWGPPSEPPNNNIYPQNEPVVLGHFPRG